MITGARELSVCSGQPVGTLSSRLVSWGVRLPRMVSPRMSPVRWAWSKLPWLPDGDHRSPQPLLPLCPGRLWRNRPLLSPRRSQLCLGTLNADKHFCLCVGHLVQKVLFWHQLHLGVTWAGTTLCDKRVLGLGRSGFDCRLRENLRLPP